jgi:hypothetical protein
MTLVCLVSFVASVGQTLAQTPGQDDAKAVEKIKLKISKLGVGEKARAQITLRDGQKMKGYISSAGASEFSFTEKTTGKTTTVAYTDVVSVKKPGLSTGAKIGIGVAIGVGALAILAAVVVHSLNHLFD